MSISATLGVFVALGAVLALLLIVLKILKRFAPSLGGGRSRLPMEVVQRLPLGPKHTLAVVRVGDRVLTVAIGEGGVQQLGELDGADRAAVLAASTTPTPFESSPTASLGILSALSASPELDRLPGGKRLRALLAHRAPSTTDSTMPSAGVVPAPTYAPPARVSAPGPDAFRSVLGMALSSATKLALVGATLAALAWSPTRVSAQVPNTTPDTSAATAATAVAATPARPADSVATPVAASVAGSPSTAARMALLEGARRQALARQPAAGRNTQAPARVGGASGARPLATGTTAPSTAGNLDTMVARLAPQLDLRVGGGKGDGLRLSGTVGIVIMMGLMTLLPTLVLMMTGFTRILIVLQFLKQALGTQSAPPNHLVAAMALLLTGFVMAPTLSTANATAIQPWLAGRMEQTEMLRVGVVPFREFMLRQTRESDLKTFVEMSRPATPPRTVDDVPLVVVMSAFVTSELRTAFQLGFALFLPFIVIDIVVSAVLMSMGMMMLPPAMIALPCKLLLFVLVDGWTLVVQSVVQSFR